MLHPNAGKIKMSSLIGARTIFAELGVPGRRVRISPPWSKTAWMKFYMREWRARRKREREQKAVNARPER